MNRKARPTRSAPCAATRSRLRRNDIVLIVKIGKKSSRFVLAVVPGHARVDTGRVKALFNGTYAGFAATDVAERLASSVAGPGLPFAFSAPGCGRGGGPRCGRPGVRVRV